MTVRFLATRFTDPLHAIYVVYDAPATQCDQIGAFSLHKAPNLGNYPGASTRSLVSPPLLPVVLSVALNLLVLLVIFHQRSRLRPTHAFIVALAGADIWEGVCEKRED